MKLITEIRRISQEKFSVLFSDGTEIKTSSSVVAEFSLCTGRELSLEEFEALSRAACLASAKARALRLVGMRAMSVGELKKKLVDKGESTENAEEAAEWLLSLGFLDDCEYAGMVARHYSGKGYGRSRIKSEFIRRRVPREYWDDALSALPCQDDKIDRLLRSKLRSEQPDRAEIKKASDSLFRRGYSWDEISSAISRFRDGVDL